VAENGRKDEPRRILIVEDGIIKEQLRAVSDKLVTHKCKGGCSRGWVFKELGP